MSRIPFEIGEPLHGIHGIIPYRGQKLLGHETRETLILYSIIFDNLGKVIFFLKFNVVPNIFK